MSCTDTCLYMGGDDYPGEFYRDATPRAAKSHRCCECGGVISKGAAHHYATGKWDGEFQAFRTCAACHEIRTVFGCDGWAFCALWDSVNEQMFCEWDEMKAIDCLARLKTQPAIAKMRTRYAAWKRTHGIKRVSPRSGQRRNDGGTDG